MGTSTSSASDHAQRVSRRNDPLSGAGTGAAWTSLEGTREASSTIREQLDLAAPLQPGLTHDEHVKWAVLGGMSDLMTTFFGNARW